MSDGSLITSIIRQRSFGTVATKRRRAHAREWITNQPGLGFVSLEIKDLSGLLAMRRDYGGVIVEETNLGSAVFMKDPDGQVVGLVEG